MGPVSPEIKYGETVDVTLGSSRRASLFLLAASGATLAILMATPMPWWAPAVLGLAVVASAFDAHRRVGRRAGRGSVCRFRFESSGRIAASDARGGTREGQVQEGSFVAPWLTLLRWRPEGTRFDRTIVILPDAIAGEEFRRLRVLLRWGGGHSVTHPAGRRIPR
jgi:hypothetical protein